MEKLVGVLLVALMALANPAVNAEERESSDELSQQGVVDYVSLSNREIVIGDMVYRLALDMVVAGDETSNTEFALQEGRLVKFELDPINNESGDKVIRSVELIDD